MTGRLSHVLLSELIEAGCPACAYPFEVQLADVRTQVFRHCPCCRTLIHLVDRDGSMYGELEAVDNAMHDLEKTLKGLFK